MLQEEQTVSFQPMENYVPWYVGLFRLYLAFVAMLAIFRFTRLLWALRRQRTARNIETIETSFSPELWEHSYIKARSFKTLAQLTLLIAVTFLAWNLSAALMQLATQKTSGVGAVSGAFADALENFSAGMIVSTALFACSAFFERLIHMHRFGPTRKASKSQPGPPTRNK